MCRVVQPLPLPHFILLSWIHKVSSCPYTVRISHPRPWATTILLSVSIDFPVLNVSYKWNHAICGLLCLASFLRIMFLKFIHVIEYISSLFFLFDCSWIVFHCMDIPHFVYPFFSPVDEYLDCFQLRAFMNSTAIMHKFLCDIYFHSLNIFLGVELLGHTYGKFMFNLLRNWQFAFL